MGEEDQKVIAGRTVYMGLKSNVNLIWESGIPLHCGQGFADYDGPAHPLVVVVKKNLPALSRG